MFSLISSLSVSKFYTQTTQQFCIF
jgi:hypothetical protein